MIHDLIKADMALFVHETDGENLSNIGFTFFSPLCIHTHRFDLYRDWTIDRILVFEAFIIYTQKYGNDFFQTRKRLLSDLRLTKYTLNKHINFLVDQGYVTKRQGGQDKNYKNFYKVNFDAIIRNIVSIYKFEVLGNENAGPSKEYYIDRFERYRENSIKFDEGLPYIFHSTRKDRI